MSNYQLPEGYKQTAIGLIPEDWKSLLLGDVITLQRGFDLPNRLRRPGNIPIVSSSGVTDTHNRYSVSCPGVVTGRYGTIGEVFFLEQNFWALNTTLFVSDFKGNDPKFIYFFLRTIDYKTYSGKSGVPGVNRNDLHEIPVKLPPIEEQKSIAKALSDVDALIAALEKAIAKKRHLKTATMQQLLTGKKRLPGFGEGKGYKESAIGLIPEDWDHLPVGNFIVEFRGGAPLKPSDFTKSGVKVLPKGGVVRGGHLTIFEKDLQFCSEQYAVKYNKNRVDESYTIVVLRDLVPSGPSIGLIVQIRNPDSFILAQGVYGFKVTEEIIPQYLIQYSNSSPYRRLMNEIMVGSTQVHITNTAFKSVELPFPSLEEQRSIATVLSDMDAEIAAIEARLAKTQAIKQGMMQELLTGRTRLV